jgi:hypothetical protein
MAGSGSLTAKGAGLVVAGTLGLAALALADVVAAQGVPPAISRDCQAQGTVTASESPLPNVAAALARTKKIKILAIGASASSGPGGAAKGGYHVVIRPMLQQMV